jgi:hypothetical protein
MSIFEKKEEMKDSKDSVKEKDEKSSKAMKAKSVDEAPKKEDSLSDKKEDKKEEKGLGDTESKVKDTLNFAGGAVETDNSVQKTLKDHIDKINALSLVIQKGLENSDAKNLVHAKAQELLSFVDKAVKYDHAEKTGQNKKKEAKADQAGLSSSNSGVVAAQGVAKEEGYASQTYVHKK